MWAGFGELLLALERHDEALTALDHALALDVEPAEASTWEAKARALRALGREGDAKRAEKTAASLSRHAQRG